MIKSVYSQLPTPAVVVELDQAKQNMQVVIEQARAQGIKVRPHIKPHKSVTLAKMQIELGCQGITCAKLGEAEVMADHGLDDILIAFPLIGEDKMTRLGHLLDQASVLTIINSMAGAAQLSQLGQAKGRVLPVLIELDGGIQRGGLQPLQPALDFARSVRNLPGIAICGLMIYSGNIYAEKNLAGFEKITRQEQEKILATAEMLKADGFCCDVLSGGNSFAAKSVDLLAGLSEIRPGNLIFNDCNQLSTGMASEEECSLRVIATVVSTIGDNRAIIDAGSKTLTTDTCKNRSGFGYVTGRPDILISKLNEEHGFLESRQPLNLAIGQKIAIIPNHACVIPNLANEIYGIRNNQVERMISIEARGQNR